MKKIKILLIFLAFIAVGMSIGGCYTDTIDNLSTFSFQFPMIFHSNYYDKAAPDTNLDYSNLNKYKEYKDNKDRINKAQILHLNYWIDSLKFTDPSNGQQVVFDPVLHKDKIEFEFIKFYLVFAKYIPNPNNPNWEDTMATHWTADLTKAPFTLGVFKNVEIAKYYRNPEHIEYVSEAVANQISDLLKTQPSFFIVSEYSRVKNQTDDKYYFPLIKARFDVVIRFDVDL
jgi:hypothetical protein